MEHLDLAGVITTPTNCWSMPAFDQQDAIYLSNSRQMLEPILEETSEDEEHAQNSWNQYEHSTSFWSSAESETGSVIRIELNKDADSISERDFACPAKRPKRGDDFQFINIPNQQSQLQLQSQQQQQQLESLDDTVLLRRFQRGNNYLGDYGEAHNSLERFLAYEASARDSYGSNSLTRSSTGSRRFDDFYSDSDSLSYQSLSRSSSLIQFESLERQLQDQHNSLGSLGNSSPSMLSFDGANNNAEDVASNSSGARSGSNSGNNSRRGSQSSLLKRFESSDGRLHQTYFDLDKLDFDDEQRVLFGAGNTTTVGSGGGGKSATVSEVKSDSESSTDSSSDRSSGHSILTTSKPSAEDLTDSSGNALIGSRNYGTTTTTSMQRLNAFQRGGKNSAENLSEDSGYCEPSTLRRTKSKSIPKNFEKFCEEEEEFQLYAEEDEDDNDDDEDDVEEEEEEDDDEPNEIVNEERENAGTETRNTHSKNSNNTDDADVDVKHYGNTTAGHDICQTKINTTTTAATMSELNVRYIGNTTTAQQQLQLPLEAATNTTRPKLLPLAAEKTKTTPSSTTTTTTTAAAAQLSNLNSQHEKSEDKHERNCLSYTTDNVINSTREQLRILAHSPSPVSSEASSACSITSNRSSSCSRTSSGSSSSSSSDASSAASFMWLPLPKQTFSDFHSTLRNSLPDLRDAFGGNNQQKQSNNIGNVLEQITKTTTTATITPIATSPIIDDTDISTTSTPNTSRSLSDATDVEATPPETRKQLKTTTEKTKTATTTRADSIAFSITSGVGGGINSLPSELHKLARRKRANKAHKSRKNKALLVRSYSSEEELGDLYTDDDGSVGGSIRRSCSWSAVRRNEQQRVHHNLLNKSPPTCTLSEGECDDDDDDNDNGNKKNKIDSFGFMQASYRDLTLLDYTGREPYATEAHDSQDTNQKRISNIARCENMAEKRNSATPDYEKLICKGNFLLDELSEIYDRNVSILNDQQLEQLNGAAGKPEKPPRQHKSPSGSQSSQLDVFDGVVADEAAVQHVQLTIRKPPARRKADIPQRTQSLHSETEESPTTITPLKTFDQDPTNLRTSYAQSLEKCNFDAKELSQSDLQPKSRTMPKRRFHGTANSAGASGIQKRNLVSSTPNLNAYVHNGDDDELENDMCVSSAHTSMHQLPQGVTPKPLGILLPVGSRSSFGKEVSFCPVVSKYSWQEQSSEECNESGNMQHVAQQQEQEESDDELLDNADATVIHNTRENEMIAARYNQEQLMSALSKQRKIIVAQLRAQPQIEKVRAKVIDTREPHLEEQEQEMKEHATEESRFEEQVIERAHETIEKTSHALPLPSPPSSTTITTTGAAITTTTTVLVSPTIPEMLEFSQKSTIVAETTSQADNFKNELKTTTLEQVNNNNTTIDNNTVPRPLSIQLPILSEPPINRAHHILYASHQLLDNFERRELAYNNNSNNNNNNNNNNSNNHNQNNKNLRTRSVSNLCVSSSSSIVRDNNGMYHYTDTAPQGVSEAALKQQQQQQQQKSNSLPLPFTNINNISNINNNNNSNSMKNTKFKDEKHPSSKGFLTRFAHGFRFSLRRKKKQQQQFNDNLQQQQQQQQQQMLMNNGNADDVNKETADIINIPLKNTNKTIGNTAATAATIDTNKKKQNNSNNNNKNNNNGTVLGASTKSLVNATNLFAKVGAKARTSSTSSNSKQQQQQQQVPQQQQQEQEQLQREEVTSSLLNEKLVTGKPPLPPSQQQQQTHAQLKQHPQQQWQQRQQQEEFLDSERSYYADNLKHQFESGMLANNIESTTNPVTIAGNLSDNNIGRGRGRGGSDVGIVSSSDVDSDDMYQQRTTTAGTTASTSTPSSQKMQMFNNMNNNRKINNNINSRIGLIETNLDTHETIITGKTRSLMDIVGPQQQQQHQQLQLQSSGQQQQQQQLYHGDNEDGDIYELDDDVKTTSSGAAQIASVRRPHKSMEFLLDKENQKNVLPPENELQKSHDHNPAALSEHQLRIQASLQRLNIPDWYRQYNQNNSRSPDGSTAYKPGNFTRKRTTESGRWVGLNSKTTSLSSLGSQRSDRSPLLLSPSAHSHHGGQSAVGGVAGVHTHSVSTSGTSAYGGGGAGFSRWSTSHLNSSQTSPSVSQRGSFTRGGPVNSSFISVASGQSGSVIRNSYRQPYLGWRSQEKLSQRTPHERLASSLLAQQQRTSPTQRTPPSGPSKLQAVTPEIQTSIKEVTSAIVHYVNDQTQQQQRSRSTSPNSRKCWLESSFVGIRPLDSPQTPLIEGTTAFAAQPNNSTSNTNSNNNNTINSNYNNTTTTATAATYNSSSATAINASPSSSTHTQLFGSHVGVGVGVGGVGIGVSTTNAEVLRMNGLSLSSGAPERSLSTASLEDVLASLLGLPSTSGSASAGAGVSTSDVYARSTTGDSASELQQIQVNYRHMPQQQKQQQQQLFQQQQQQHEQQSQQQQQQQLQVLTQAEQQRLRRRSEGDAPNQQQQQNATNAKNPTTTTTTTTDQCYINNANANANITNNNNNNNNNNGVNAGSIANNITLSAAPARRVSLGDSSESANNKTINTASATSADLLPIKCRNTKCDRSASTADAKKYYKSCHNCSHLYCSRECRRAHWEKHRKACLHSRASNLCRQVLATCKDDLDSQRHLSLLARKGYLSQGRGVVRVLFRSAEAAEGFIKHGFQCMGEASYVRWPDLMPAEMGLELYSELLKLSTEYKPESKMLIYVAICVVSEAPGMGQAPVRWERQLVSRCAKLKLCKSILAELDAQQQALQQQPLTVLAVPEPTTEILILTFNPSLRTSVAQRELILANILDILSRRGVLLRKHYPEVFQRLQSYAEGQTDKFNPVTLHPRDSQTGQSFVCIIMPVHSDSEIISLPSAADGGNRVTSIDVGSPAALAQLDEDDLFTHSSS